MLDFNYLIKNICIPGKNRILSRSKRSVAQQVFGEQVILLHKQLTDLFLNSFCLFSLMVEELARWKASLISKNKRLLEANKHMLQTTATVRELQLETWMNLKFLCGQRDANLKSTNVLDLTAECLNISQQLVLHSGIGMPAPIDLTGLDKTTAAEKLAVEVRFYFQVPSEYSYIQIF